MNTYAQRALHKKNINLFRIPNVTTTKGHYFSAMKDKIFTGNLEIMTESQKIWVEFKNFDGQLYAKAIMAQNFRLSLEKTVDSARGFAIKLTNDDGR